MDEPRARGERLLREVKEESLAELLHTLHHLHVPPPASPKYEPLGIKPLDDILRVFQQRSHTSTYAPSAEGAATFTPRLPVLEITSFSSADGKTHLLYYITALAILPGTYHGIALPGRNGAIVFLDTDCRFDAVRLREVARGIVLERAAEQGILLLSGNGRGSGGRDEDEELNKMLHTALSHVHVFRPQSSGSLLATIRSVESYLLNDTVGGEYKHASHSRPLHAILLDSASAFYWQDRRELEILNIPGVREERARARKDNEDGNDNDNNSNNNNKNNNTPPSQLPHQIIHALRELQHTFSCPLVFTTWGLLPVTPRISSASRPDTLSHVPTITPLYRAHRMSFRPHLPRPWPSFPTCRVIVQRDVVRPFAPFLTMEEVRGEAEERQEVVRRGRVVGWVDGNGLGWERERERERERQAMAERVFGFSLTEGGGIRWLDGNADADGDGEG
ncbi:hypothetical protein ACJ72_00505 [Emergomyces africanus]|uniref:DNA recombination and repair protein Rad51-like C-terminal domain-containing protein n=1 Tax=Emergomyces africanus TaxID=1955775 RepID=A0A1B7P806_9EURO|nr:hypothetical protein ACJ72_00505 [Emergomyces africanus]